MELSKKQAYEFFFKALSARMIAVMNELDTCQIGSQRYDALTAQQIRLQTALANLDDIHNLA